MPLKSQRRNQWRRIDSSRSGRTGYDEHKGDHIDFVYAPDTWISNEASTVTVGCFDDYASGAKRRSDHAPVIAELTPKPLR